MHILFTIEVTNLIKINLKRYVDAAKISINKLSKATGISRPTLTAMYNGESTGIQFNTLETLCSFFNISISSLLKLDIPFERFNFINLSGNIDTEKYGIIGIAYSRPIRETTNEDIEVAPFIIRAELEKPEKIVNNKKTGNKQIDSILSKSSSSLPAILNFDIEWVANNDLDRIYPYTNKEVINELKNSNMLMNYGETISLYLSFSKDLMAQIGASIVGTFASNSKTLSKINTMQIEINFNFGTASSMEQGKFRFMYMLKNNTLMSLDMDSDGIDYQFEYENTYNSPEIDAKLKPLLYSLIEDEKTN